MKKLANSEMEKVNGGSAISSFCFFVGFRTLAYAAAGGMWVARAIGENYMCWNN